MERQYSDRTRQAKCHDKSGKTVVEAGEAMDGR